MGKFAIVITLLFSFLSAGNYLPMEFGYATFDHDTGNCILAVCANGAIGFWDSNQIQGSGFWYPQWVNQTLFCASNACGNASDYVVDSYFGPNWEDDRDWEPMEDSIDYHVPPEFDLQEVDCIYADHGSTNANPKGLQCYQYSVASPSPDYDDFVILEFIYNNSGSSAINSLYSGIFVDFDIPNSMRNYVKTDSARRTVYMKKSQSEDNPTVGVVYLGSEPQPVLPVANLAAVPHYDYVNTGFLDSFKYFWLNSTYQKAESDSEGDWSVMMSAGPFDLDVGAEQHAAFAFVGGTSESEYLQHCQNAIDFYVANWPEVKEEINSVGQNIWLNTNLVTDYLSINYSIQDYEEVEVCLYDLNGRKIAQIYSGELSGKGRIKWDFENVATGMYFLWVKTRQEIQCHKVIVVKQ